MKCKISDWGCVYHACMTDDCQRRHAPELVKQYGPGRCRNEQLQPYISQLRQLGYSVRIRRKAEKLVITWSTRSHCASAAYKHNSPEDIEQVMKRMQETIDNTAMQNEQTLIELGFSRHPEWDGESAGSKHYRKEVNGKIFRAYVIDYNRPVYVSLGEVCTPDGKVKQWRDCCSPGSVARKINGDE